ncbi:MAG TPA: hypothetical protein ENG12_04375 [Candidatus Altiarchaeales archaeon]|nr:MAG: hypothetical protein B6U86_00865 [Candidatus Altiarchaeales archaeon ex4484_43]HDH41622.1 hypothetical protein [Candidatus Altiarchaeales archaeon]
MNSLIFRRGYKNWKTTYRVEINFEYTADLEKRLTDVTLHQLDINRSVTIPWSIFRSYLDGDEDGIYADASGLTIRTVDEGILVSDSRFLNILIHRDQMEAIKRAAKNVREDISESVERILREFTTHKVPSRYGSG